jgi:hypothetical protein
MMIVIHCRDHSPKPSPFHFFAFEFSLSTSRERVYTSTVVQLLLETKTTQHGEWQTDVVVLSRVLLIIYSLIYDDQLVVVRDYCIGLWRRSSSLP